jgi:UDP-N-acetyl-2-amino-2-deoxyglucuronate dehydrogenase
MENFAIIGCAGYIAPRHLKAIKDTGNSLSVALDKSDSVGILDNYFENVDFFTEFERFDRHIEKLKKGKNKIDYVSICSPNYLHDAHIRFALRAGANAICEKPLVINPWNLSYLEELGKETGKKIFGIVQLRHHPEIIKLKKRVEKETKENPEKEYELNLNYIASRGKWYNSSWKGDLSKSGGILMNLGIHFFDMLLWIFGPVKSYTLDFLEKNKAKGELSLEKAKIKWFLSSDKNDLPQEALEKGIFSHRKITLNEEDIEFSEGFTELHTKAYEEILLGRGFEIKDLKPSIELVYKIKKLKNEKKLLSS